MTLISYGYGETLTSQDDKTQGHVGLNMDQTDISKPNRISISSQSISI